MKKIFVLGSVLALAACGNNIDVAQHDADFAGCERIETTKEHLVYKCPADQEWIATVKTQEPNVKFFRAAALTVDDMSADTEHTYVEVVLGDAAQGCKEDFHYRTMVKPYNAETQEFYAVLSCKTIAEEQPAEQPVEK